METTVINGKRFVIKKGNNCDKCLFRYDGGYTKPAYHCYITKCYDFIVIREVNVIDKIRLWFNKKKL